MKANLTSLKITADQARVDDCLSLVDRATKEVREMSQLLRPTILDDFGLWLGNCCFVEHHGIGFPIS